MGEVAGVSVSVMVRDSATRQIALLASSIRNLDPALDEIGSSLVTSTQQRFEREEGPKGEPWEGLAISTLRKKGREKGDGEAEVLRDNNHLYDSLTHEVEGGVGTHVGVTRVYGRIHQLGGKAGRNHSVDIKARPYLGIDDDDRAEVIAILSDYMKAGL